MKTFFQSLTRRKFVAVPLAAPAAFAAPAGKVTFEAAPIYQRLGVRPFINAVGTITTFSGTLMSAEVRRAMDEASRNFIHIHELQEKAGARIAALTGAEAAFVTSGASCALCLATCAVTAGDDQDRMKRLPDLTGLKSEMVIQKRHRNMYDHAFRMVGVKLIEVETAGQMKSAIGPKTAAVAFVASHHVLGHKVELDEVAAIAHSAGLPVILDAAAEIPPASNLSKFVKMGVDLVAFSGGKNLRGPQCSGILMGKRDLIRKAYANSSPNNYFARIAKVGKEEIAGLVVALEMCLAKDHEAERRNWHTMLDRVAAHLQSTPTVHTEYITNSDFSHSPRLSIQWDEAKLGISLEQMIERLRAGSPSIEASDMRNFNPPWKGLGIFPYNLNPGEEMIIAARVKEILTRA
ncbi:MAG: aminotransferase class V-fold PLP-dependent enzyme [Acidobacteriia bacterium]|nr:aminotransferase class V-fold PLP-dependent enzyme [Terriglobia bacterium]